MCHILIANITTSHPMDNICNATPNPKKRKIGIVETNELVWETEIPPSNNAIAPDDPRLQLSKEELIERMNRIVNCQDVMTNYYESRIKVLESQISECRRAMDFRIRGIFGTRVQDASEEKKEKTTWSTKGFTFTKGPPPPPPPPLGAHDKPVTLPREENEYEF